MGSYAELVINCTLKTNTPREMVEVFLSMQADPFYSFEVIPDGFVGLGVCSYFPQISYAIVNWNSTGDKAHVSVRLAQKGAKELAALVEWIRPYVEDGSGPNDLFATIHLEENEKPNLYFVKPKSMTMGELVAHKLEAAQERIGRLEAELAMLRSDLPI